MNACKAVILSDTVPVVSAGEDLRHGKYKILRSRENAPQNDTSLEQECDDDQF